LPPFTDLMGLTAASLWLTEFSFGPNMALMLIFMASHSWDYSKVVQQGIERCPVRLMPLLLLSLGYWLLYV